MTNRNSAYVRQNTSFRTLLAVMPPDRLKEFAAVYPTFATFVATYASILFLFRLFL